MGNMLSGVRVVELATFIAVPSAGRFLADLGADVIKVESPAGDPFRFTAGGLGASQDPAENVTFDLENANKRGLVLDLKKAEERQVLEKLLARADVFLTNWRPGALERAGLDYAALHRRFPKLVYGCCTGYGEKGPDRDLPGFDSSAFAARGGYIHGLHEQGQPPMVPAPGMGDHCTGMNLAAGVLAALYHARESGQGEKVSVSLYHSAVYSLGTVIQAAQFTDLGRPYPQKAREATNPIERTWPTADGRYVTTVMPVYDLYFPKFMAAIGREELARDPRYYPLNAARANDATGEVYDLVRETVGQMTSGELSRRLTAADIPFSVAYSWEEVLEDEQAWDNDIFYSMHYPNGKQRVLVRPPVQFAGAGLPEYRPGPAVGEHTEQILRELQEPDT